MVRHTVKILMIFFCIISLSSFAQKKIKNEFAYKKDPLIYYFQQYTPTVTTIKHKDLLQNIPADSLSTLKINRLVEAKSITKIQDLFLIKYPSRKSQHPLFHAPVGSVLGPYKTRYGSYKFVKICLASKEASQVFRGYSYTSEILVKQKGHNRKILNTAKQFVRLFSEGKGNKKAILNKINKYRGNKSKLINEVYKYKTTKALEEAPTGCSALYVEYPNYILLINLSKREEGRKYVSYDEYIFK